MPLLTLEQVAADLGLKSVQSVRNLAARGEITIVPLLITGTRGSPRVDSADLEAYKRRLRERAGGVAVRPPRAAAKPAPRRPGRAAPMRF